MISVSCDGSQAPTYTCSAPLNQAAYNWTAGTHHLFVQAVGMPSIQNHLSGGSADYAVNPIPNFSSSSISFPNTTLGFNSTATLSITNTGNANLNIPPNGFNITVGSNVFSVMPPSSGCTVQPNGPACNVTVTFNPLACQTYSGTLSITDNAANSPQAIALSGTGVSGGSCAAPSSISPMSYSFPDTTVGSQNTSPQFIFTNQSGATLTNPISLPSGYVFGSNGCSSVQNTQTCTFTVKFQPTTVATYQGSITAKDGSGTVIASAAITGNGVSQSGAVLYSQIQNINGWTYCTSGGSACGGGNGGATASYTPNVTSVEFQGNPSAQYSIAGTTPYSNALFSITLSPKNNVSHFKSDMWINVTDPTAPQALTFQFAQAIGNLYYPFQFQCDFKGSQAWRVWDPGSSTMVSTGVACTASLFPANTWVHLTFSGERTSGNQLHYTGFSVDNNSYSLNLLYGTATKSPDDIDLNFTLHGDANQTPFSIYVDNFTLYDTSPQPALGATPATLDMGVQPLGQLSETRQITLTNSGTADLPISSLNVLDNTNQFVTPDNNCGGTILAGSNCTVHITFQPNTYGSQVTYLFVNGTQTASITGASLDPSKVLYSQIQNNSTWTICTSTSCVGGNGGATGTFNPNQTTPEINLVNSAQFSIGGSTGYSNVGYEDVLGAQNAITQFRVDADVYIANPSSPQNLVFTLEQVVNSASYPFQLMCDFKGGGIWKVWNDATTGNHWVPTTAPCTPSTFAANDWTHIAFTILRTSGNQMQYVTLSVGANTYNLNSALYDRRDGESGSSVDVIFQESGDSRQDAYTVYLDNLIVSQN